MTDQDRGLRRDLLQELLWIYGPCGQEDAVRDVCRRELEPFVDETWVDQAGNLVGLIHGRSSNNGGSGNKGERGDGYDGEGAPGTRVMDHLDELSMLVKRMEPDGTLHLTPLGTMYPANFGLGPVAVLGDRQTVTGVLSLGRSARRRKVSGSGRRSLIRETRPWTGRTSTSSPAAPQRS